MFSFDISVLLGFHTSLIIHGSQTELTDYVVLDVVYFWFRTLKSLHQLGDLEQVTFLELSFNIGKLLMDYFIDFCGRIR